MVLEADASVKSVKSRVDLCRIYCRKLKTQKNFRKLLPVWNTGLSAFLVVHSFLDMICCHMYMQVLQPGGVSRWYTCM